MSWPNFYDQDNILDTFRIFPETFIQLSEGFKKGQTWTFGPVIMSIFAKLNPKPSPSWAKIALISSKTPTHPPTHPPGKVVKWKGSVIF